MPEPYDIVPYSDTFAGPARKLVLEVMGPTAATPVTEQFWAWKHDQNPFGSSYGLCAMQHNRMLSLRVLMQWSFEATDGSRIRAGRAVDTVTRPSCQRMGLFSSLTKQALGDLGTAGVHVIFNTPNSKSLPGYLGMGWKDLGKVPLFISALRPRRILRGILFPPKAGTPEMAALAPFFADDVPAWSEFRAGHVGAVSVLVASMERNRPRTGYRTPRSMEYLDWRYGGHPSVTYRVVTLEENGALRGFAVLRPNVRHGLLEAVLCELFFMDADPAAGRRLIRRVRQSTRADYLIAHFSEASVERSLLRAPAFWRIPRKGITLAVRLLNETCTDPLTPENWDLTLGDLEIF